MEAEMETFRVDGGDLVLRLTLREKVAALRGDVRVPVSAVRSVEVVDEPLRAVRGIRAPGVGIPAGAKVGTWRRRGGPTFAVVWGGGPGVRVRLDGQRYAELVVTVPDPRTTAAELRAGARR
jgi:hypothetical protein